MKRFTGASTLEFTLVCLLFMSLAMGAMELGRLMFIHVTAAAATRMGARLATVCGPQDTPFVQQRMNRLLSLIGPPNIVITYPADGCRAQTCEPVRVQVAPLGVRLNLPFAPLDIRMPSFATALPAENLDSAQNPLCR